MTDTRFAPSPTGPLHIGGLRTALFNYLMAKKTGGKFLLRIEDTDKERSEKKWEKEIFDNLEILGLNWNNGIERQSERGESYKKYLEKLLNDRRAYYCFCTKEELDIEREEMRKQKKAPVHAGKYRDLPLKEALEKIAKGERAVIRLKVERGKDILFKDKIRGEVKINTDDIGDFVIAKDLDNPLYNLTCVVDDSLMGIDLVIRGEEHIPNTPKQMLIAEALNFKIPEYAHISLILGTDKKKLSKREGSTAVSEYIKNGYLPEAIINFIAFLGWNPGGTKEIYSMQELIKDFSIEKIQKSGAVFNIEKLDWINGLYIRNMDIESLEKRCIPYLESKKGIDNKKVLAVCRDRMKKLSDIADLSDYFFNEPKYEDSLLLWKNSEKKDIMESLKTALALFEKREDMDEASIQEELMEKAKSAPSVGVFMWPLRVALSGREASVGPAEIAGIIGRDETIKRIKKAIAKL